MGKNPTFYEIHEIFGHSELLSKRTVGRGIILQHTLRLVNFVALASKLPELKLSDTQADRWTDKETNRKIHILTDTLHRRNALCKYVCKSAYYREKVVLSKYVAYKIEENNFQSFQK